MSVSPNDTAAASGPDDLTITEAVEMYLDKRTTDATDIDTDQDGDDR